MTVTDAVAPKPRLTPDLDKQERHTDAIMEAQDLVFATVGAPQDGDPLGAFARGQLVVEIAKAITAAEERGTLPRVIPTLIPVWGDLERPDVVVDAEHLEQVPGPNRTEGLRCPHCFTIAWDGGSGTIIVIDEGSRENHFEYSIDQVDEFEPCEVPVQTSDGRTIMREGSRRTGRKIEARAIVGGYGGGADMQGAGYACGSCERRVALPEGVEEVGD